MLGQGMTYPTASRVNRPTLDRGPFRRLDMLACGVSCPAAGDFLRLVGENPGGKEARAGGECSLETSGKTLTASASGPGSLYYCGERKRCLRAGVNVGRFVYCNLHDRDVKGPARRGLSNVPSCLCRFRVKGHSGRFHNVTMASRQAVDRALHQTVHGRPLRSVATGCRRPRCHLSVPSSVGKAWATGCNCPRWRGRDCGMCQRHGEPLGRVAVSPHLA